MKRTAAAGRSSRSRGTSTLRKPRTSRLRGAYYVLCVKNDGYPSSLDVRKIYRALRDPDAEKHGQIRVIDESGEDYLFSSRYFVRLPMPAAAKRALAVIT
jgi:hypothetical protein